MRQIRNSRIFSKSTRRGLSASRLRKGAVWCGIPRAHARGSPESGDRNSLCCPQGDRRAPRGPHDARRATATSFAVEVGKGRGGVIPIVLGGHNGAMGTPGSGSDVCRGRQRTFSAGQGTRTAGCRVYSSCSSATKVTSKARSSSSAVMRNSRRSKRIKSMACVRMSRGWQRRNFLPARW